MNYGEFGGQYVPQKLKERLQEIEREFLKTKENKKFQEEYKYYLEHYVGRPSPLYYAENLTKALGGAKIYLKREDLNHTGAHKINNTIGQILLAKRMEKTHIIAETGAGQHGVATATVCSLFKMKCTIFMGKEDIERLWSRRLHSLHRCRTVQYRQPHVQQHNEQVIHNDAVS